jgi:hydrogenase-1 operon protein HyaF
MRAGIATRRGLAIMNSPSKKLKDLPIYAQAEEAYSVGNIRALLTEIAARLEKLAHDGTTGMIDLNSLPFAPGEYEQLRQTLGQGEVSAHIEAIGASEITETRYSGVWWVTHYNVEGDIVADSIEITAIPEILKSQPEDIKMGLELLRVQLNDAQLNDAQLNDAQLNDKVQR